MKPRSNFHVFQHKLMRYQQEVSESAHTFQKRLQQSYENMAINFKRPY